MARDPEQETVREVRQRLESLRRAGVDRIPQLAVPQRTPESPAQRSTEPEVPPARASRESAQSTSGGDAPAPEAHEAPPARSSRAAAVPSPVTLTSPVSLFDDSLAETPPLAPAERVEQLDALRKQVAACVRCPVLAESRTQTVFGEGSPTARLMFIGEAPGADEDRTGRPFVGRAGQLLNDMITKGMGLAREDVYIANILKSRPPENRAPLPDETAHCLPYLERQIDIIRPEFLCLLGKTAVVGLLQADPTLSLGRLRQRWHKYRGIPTLVTYHPAYLLRNPASKKDAWEDLQMLMSAMGLKPPARRSE